MAIQTNVVWNREFTQDEISLVQAQSAAAVAAGTTDGKITGGPTSADQVTPIVRIWTTTDAANAWVTFVNTFSPAPVSATVTS
jgi:hypothetical protein